MGRKSYVLMKCAHVLVNFCFSLKKFAQIGQAGVCYIYSTVKAYVEFSFYHNSPMSFLFNIHAKLHIRLAECSNIQIFCGVWCMLISTHSHSCAPLCIMCSKAKHSGDNLLSSLPTHSSILLTEAAQWATLQLVRTQEKKSLSQQESNYTYANILPVSRITRKNTIKIMFLLIYAVWLSYRI